MAGKERQRTKTHDGRNKRTSNSDLKAGTQGRGALGEPRRSQAWIYSGFGRVLTGKLAGAERESSNIDTKRGGFFGADNVVFSMKQKRKERNSGQDGIVRTVTIAAMDFRNLWMRALFANRLSRRGKAQSAKTRTACGLFLKQRSARSLPTRLKKGDKSG